MIPTMALAGKKIAVWFKGRQLLRHACVSRGVPTDPMPGAYLMVIEYDDLGNLLEVEVEADSLVVTCSDVGATALGGNLSGPIDLEG